MKFGIIGSGMIARFHAKAIEAMPGSELRSIYSRNAASSGTLREEFGCQVFDNLDAFLTDPELEIVTIATPSGAHLEPSVAAARAGKHVICEKPLEITTNRVDQMAASAKNAA